MRVTPELATESLERALRLYTPSMAEAPMAEFLSGLCADLGFEGVRTDGAGNLIATRGSGAPRTMLCGHMDVVPGKVRVRREGDALHGRGASDAKAPLMAMLFAAASAPEGSGTAVFVGAVDEEGSAAGVKSLARGDLRADYAVFGEPSGLERITIAYKGRLAISLRVSAADSSHASAPWLSKNAIEEAMVFAAELKGRLEEGQGSRSRGMARTATMTEIRGGISHNVTPKECEAVFDIRVPVDGSCKGTEREIAAAVRETAGRRGVEAFYSILDETEPFEAAHDSPLVRALMLGVNDVVGRRPTLIRKTGTGDMNVLGNRWGIPVVTYGPGDPHEAHTVDEKVSVSEYLRGIEVLRRALAHLGRLHGR